MGKRKLVINGRFLVQSITGVQRVAREVLTSLDGMLSTRQLDDVEVRVLVPARGTIIEEPRLSEISIERVGRLPGHFWEQFELPKYAGDAHLLCLGNLAPILRLYGSNPTVTMVHDLSYKYFPHAYDWKFRMLYSALMPVILRKCSRVVTVSKAEQDSIEKHYPFLQNQDRLSFAQNGGIPDSKFPNEADDSAGEIRENIGIYVGSLTARKNAPGIIEACKRLAAEDGMRFIFIGASGPSFESVTIEIPEELQGQFEFWGQVNDSDRIYDAFRRSRVLVFPSFYEASPLPPIEAMTFGCPVVASDIPSLRERCGDAAEYCDPNDVDSIVTAARTILKTNDSWQEFSKRGRIRAAQFTWSNQVNHLLELLNDDQ